MSTVVETYEKDTPKHGHGFSVKRLVSAAYPYVMHFFCFLAFWFYGTFGMMVAGWIVKPAWWMVYGFFVGTIGWDCADAVKRMILQGTNDQA